MPLVVCYWNRNDDTQFLWNFWVDDGNVPQVGDAVMLPVKSTNLEEFDEPCVDGKVIFRRWCFTYDKDDELETSVRLEVIPDDAGDFYVPDDEKIID